MILLQMFIKNNIHKVFKNMNISLIFYAYCLFNLCQLNNRETEFVFSSTNMLSATSKKLIYLLREQDIELFIVAFIYTVKLRKRECRNVFNLVDDSNEVDLSKRNNGIHELMNVLFTEKWSREYHKQYEGFFTSREIYGKWFTNNRNR